MYQILCEDELLHTEENGYECDDPDCICHWENCNRWENEHNLVVSIQRAEYEAREHLARMRVRYDNK